MAVRHVLWYIPNLTLFLLGFHKDFLPVKPSPAQPMPQHNFRRSSSWSVESINSTKPQNLPFFTVKTGETKMNNHITDITRCLGTPMGVAWTRDVRPSHFEAPAPSFGDALKPANRWPEQSASVGHQSFVWLFRENRSPIV